MSSATRTGLTALALSAALLLAGCGGDAEADAGTAAASGHGHDMGAMEAPATVADGGTDSPYSGLHLRDPYQKPQFTLTDGTGAAYDFAARTAAGPTLLFFGYTNCPDVCPTTMADVAIALRTTDPAVVAATTVVFVTTDPARDTPEVLEEYLGRFDADLGTSFVGLTGDQAQIEQAQLAAGVPLAGDEGRTHSAMLLLYGTDGQADVAFNGGNTATDIAHDLAVVAAE
ncbi:SCO family protein [Modestobacter sp. SSW1-42]|uniref:SCO family protein n=1 Tax=Modestobacter sp. SSW1-42 TaxID=596372 RepID=UPI003986A4BF